MYSFESRIRYSEVGEDKKLTLAGVINYFQDCSTFHSEDIGVGVGYLEQQKAAWVLSSWQIVVERYADLCEEVIISTWPYAFSGFSGHRNFTMKDKEGKLIAYANTLWAYIDAESGRLVRVPEKLQKMYKMEERLPMEYASRKVSMPKDGIEKEAFPVHKHHLDTYHHVNNGQYIEMAKDFAPPDFRIHEMRAEYKKSAVLGDTIYPVRKEENGVYTIALCDETKKPYAVVELKGRKDYD